MKVASSASPAAPSTGIRPDAAPQLRQEQQQRWTSTDSTAWSSHLFALSRDCKSAESELVALLRTQIHASMSIAGAGGRQSAVVAPPSMPGRERSKTLSLAPSHGGRDVVPATAASLLSSSSAAASATGAATYSALLTSLEETRDNSEQERKEIYGDIKRISNGLSTVRNGLTELAASASDAADNIADNDDTDDPCRSAHLDADAVRKVAAAADNLSSSIFSFRDKQRKAYLRLMAQEEQLSKELDSVLELVTAIEGGGAGGANDMGSENELNGNQGAEVAGDVTSNAGRSAGMGGEAASHHAAAAPIAAPAAATPLALPTPPISPLHAVSEQLQTSEHQQHQRQHQLQQVDGTRGGQRFEMGEGGEEDNAVADDGDSSRGNVSSARDEMQPASESVPVPAPVPESAAPEKVQSLQSLVAIRTRMDVIKSQVSTIDSEIDQMGGSTGGWPKGDHASFMACLAVLLSERGRPRALSVMAVATGPTAAASAGGTRVHDDGAGAAHRDADKPLLSPADSSALTERLRLLLPNYPHQSLSQHIDWYCWWRKGQATKLRLASEWRELKGQERHFLLLSDQDAGDGGGGGSSRRCSTSDRHSTDDDGSARAAPTASAGTDINTRIAVAEWRARRAADQLAAQQREAAEKAAIAAAAALKAAEEQAARKAQLEEWKGSGHGYLSERGSPRRCPRGIGAAPHEPSSAAARVDPTILKLRAKVALESAAAKHKEIQEKKAKMQGRGGTDSTGSPGKNTAPIPAYLLQARAAGGGGDDGAGVGAAVGQFPSQAAGFEFWSRLPADPARPTTASSAHVTLPEQAQARVQSIRAGSAHEAPVASAGVRSQGRSFGFGAGGVLPSRAVPAWRKVAQR